MSREQRRQSLSIILIFSFILSIFPIQPQTTAAAGMTVAECSQKYNYLAPPPGFPICNSAAKVWNKKLYDDLGVMAYGDILQANTSGDFKADWQDLDGNVRSDSSGGHPYFTRNGVKGEYRYFGWDKNNALYSNAYFINDSKKGTDPNTRSWIYRPWNSGSLIAGRSDKPASFSPILSGTFNSPDQIYQTGQVNKVNSIVRVDSLQVRTSAKNEDPNTAVPKNLFDYMYVEQDPSVWAEGQGRMWHLKPNGDVWYQSFTLDKLVGKQKPGIVADIIPKNITTTDLAKLGKSWRWSLDLKGDLNDSAYFNDRYKKALYYTRSDVKEWTLQLQYAYPGQSLTTLKTFTSKNTGDISYQNQGKIALSNISIPFNKGSMAKGSVITFVLTTTARYQTADGSSVYDQDSDTYEITLGETPSKICGNNSTVCSGYIPGPTNKPIEQYQDYPPPVLPPGIGGPPPVVCKADLPNDAFDIVEYGASDLTDMTRISNRQVWVDGVSVDPVLFFSGGYVFGDDADGLRTVTMKWTPTPGEDKNGANMCDTYKIVNVHDTKPRAQFKLNGDTYKENRKLSVDNTSTDPNANDPFVQATYPIISSSWSWSASSGSSDSDRRMKVDDPNHKEFLYKKPGEYVLTLTVTNALGRTSEPYVLPFSIIPDYAPAVILHPYSSQIARGEGVSLNFDAVSTDKDTITNKNFKVYYDVNNDGTYSQLIDAFSGALSEYKPVKNKLGKYRIVVTVDENYGQDTFPEFLTAADKRSTTKQFEFEIDNYIPYNDIYTDIPTTRQTVDAFFLLDKNLAQNKINYVTGNGVTISNQLRSKGTDPIVNVWDMHTYTYTQPASTTVNTGSYPPPTYDYCAEGYCGTLNLQSASDNGYYYDFGSYQTVVDVPGHNEYYTVPWCYSVIRGITYSHDVPCDSDSNLSTKTEQRWVDTTYKQVWVSNVQWVSNYYGTYSGTIYKDIRQPYYNPFDRTASSKFVIYMSDNVINEMADFSRVAALTDAKIILIGNPSIKGQTGYDKFIENTGQPIEDIVQSVVNYISSLTPPTATSTVLVNQTFNFKTDESDPEADPIVQRQTMYIHDENFYDNAQGHAAFAASSYNAANWTNATYRTSFSLPGEYRILRRVKDQPSNDPKFASYSYYSNEAETIVRVHRKPFAVADLDWKYDPNCGCYQTTWVDKSYDLDHNISDPVNRGIVQRKISYTVNGEKYYKIPSQLSPGTYHLEYVVKDVEGAWSDPFIMDFTLDSTPPPQLKSQLKAENPSFSISGGVPASERLVAYGLWTRYPYSLGLTLQMPPGGGYINQSIPYYTGTKSGSDIWWNDVGMTIPATTPDGWYSFRIQANGSEGGTFAYNDHSVYVFTPINLQPQLPLSNDLLVVGYPATLQATTTKYPSTATATLFYGTGYAQTVGLTATSTTSGKTWKYWTSSFSNVPDGNYTIRFTATNPTGKSETKDVPIRVTRNTPPFGDFKSYTYDSNNTTMPIFEGDTVHFDPVGVGDNERDTLDVNYTVKDPTGTIVLNQNLVYNYPYPTNAGPTLVVSKVGTYTVTLTLNDRKAAPVVITHTFNVNALGIAGTVTHTAQWETNRVNYNLANPMTPRPADTFWAGEQFILASSVTNTGSSWDKANSIAVTLIERSVTVNLTNTSGLNWGGSMWQSNFDTLPDGTYNFKFSVTYSNGVVKTTTVPVRIKDSIWDVTKTHRIN